MTWNDTIAEKNRFTEPTRKI